MQRVTNMTGRNSAIHDEGYERSKFLGCLLGLAIGDVLGWPTELLSLNGIRTRFGPQGVTDFEAHPPFPPGTYTDDTQMTLCIAQALIETRGLVVERTMDAVARNFVVWLHSPDNNRSPGTTCLGGCRNLARGVHWSKSGIPTRPGCGSAMRVAPIGLFYHHNEELLREMARATCIATHAHPTAVASAVGMAYLVGLAFRGEDPGTYVQRVLSFVGDEDRDFVEAIEKVPQVVDNTPDKAFQVLGEGWLAHEALAGAVFCVLRGFDSFERTVLLGANTQGDSDSIACMAGAIQGARLGLQAKTA